MTSRFQMSDEVARVRFNAIITPAWTPAQEEAAERREIDAAARYLNHLKRIRDGAPVLPSLPCGADDCELPAEPCWCGNAHCPDHPHTGNGS